MPWVEVTEPYAQPPRLRPVAPATDWSGPVELDRGWMEFDDVVVERESGCDLAGCVELTVTDSVLDGITLGEPGMVVEVRSSELRGCDLSGATIQSLVATRVEGCKLTGTDLSGASVHDVEFVGCLFRQTNLRLAQLRRVRFQDCTFDDADCYELRAEHVEFPGTSLDGVNVDRMEAEQVDFRTAKALVLTGLGSLSGCLVGEHQIPALAYPLALAAGADIERGPQ